MAVESSGTQTATPGTLHTLASPTTDKTRVLTVDVSALTGTEYVELTINEPVLSGGTVRVLRQVRYNAGHAEPITKSQAFEMAFGGTFTLRQVGGTGRAFPWRVVALPSGP